MSEQYKPLSVEEREAIRHMAESRQSGASIDLTLRLLACLEAAEQRERELVAVLADLRDIINGSDGVEGWHRNGDLATWDEFGYPDQIDQVLSEVPSIQSEEETK